MRDFISNEQKAVVEYRQSIGYSIERMQNGFWLCYKGRHKMIINGLGYDTYTGV
jgi:hypothetical protein